MRVDRAEKYNVISIDQHQARFYQNREKNLNFFLGPQYSFKIQRNSKIHEESESGEKKMNNMSFWA
jgi:hypothetical protein